MTLIVVKQWAMGPVAVGNSADAGCTTCGTSSLGGSRGRVCLFTPLARSNQTPGLEREPVVCVCAHAKSASPFCQCPLKGPFNTGRPPPRGRVGSPRGARNGRPAPPGETIFVGTRGQVRVPTGRVPSLWEQPQNRRVCGDVLLLSTGFPHPNQSATARRVHTAARRVPGAPAKRHSN